jgi:hypothetical protein
MLMKRRLHSSVCRQERNFNGMAVLIAGAILQSHFLQDLQKLQGLRNRVSMCCTTSKASTSQQTMSTSKTSAAQAKLLLIVGWLVGWLAAQPTNQLLVGCASVHRS